MSIDAAAAERLVRAHTAALRGYVGTEPHAHLVGLLEALQATYMHDLVDVTPQDLQLKQGALRQVMALTRALTGELIDTPRI